MKYYINSYLETLLTVYTISYGVLLILVTKIMFYGVTLFKSAHTLYPVVQRWLIPFRDKTINIKIPRSYIYICCSLAINIRAFIVVSEPHMYKLNT